jgi:hypothetical protein
MPKNSHLHLQYQIKRHYIIKQHIPTVMKKTLIAFALVGISLATLAAPTSGKNSTKKATSTATTTTVAAEAAPAIDNAAEEQLAYENMMKAMFSRLAATSVPATANYEFELGQLRLQNQILAGQIEELNAQVAFSNMMTAAVLQASQIETPIVSKKKRRH